MAGPEQTKKSQPQRTFENSWVSDLGNVSVADAQLLAKWCSWINVVIT